MKKNYLYPQTEVIQLNGCSIMQDLPNSKTPIDPPSADPFKAPLRKVSTLYV